MKERRVKMEEQKQKGAGPHLSIVKVGKTPEEMRKAIIDMSRNLMGREPTEEELAEMDEYLQSPEDMPEA